MPSLTSNQQQQLRRKLTNCREYCESFLRIRTKEGKLEKLQFNAPQEKLYKAIREQAQLGVPIRIIILKARQLGFSTMAGAVIFQRTATRPDTESLVVAHKADATANLFGMYRTYYEQLPKLVQPMRKAANGQEMILDNPSRDPEDRRKHPGLRSRIRCATAGGQGVGRSFTVQNVHMSEYAFWPGDKNLTFAGIMQAVPDNPGTIVIIESTANGFDDFKDKWDDSVAAWDKGERDGFRPIFFAWYENPQYRRQVPPDFQATPEELELMSAYSLDLEQICWRRWCIRNNCGGSMDLFHQEYPATPDEAFVASGACIFDTEKLILQRARARKLERKTGCFAYVYNEIAITHWDFKEDAHGQICIIKTPEEGHPYVIGGDTSGEGSDYFAAHVIDNHTGELVAVLHQQNGEGEYVRQVYCLGRWYNSALIGIESNFSTYANNELNRLGYNKLFLREVPDVYTGAKKKAFGFRTDTITRPLILSELVELMDQHPEVCTDYETLGEMLTFVRKDTGKAEAQEGKHDDLVMSYAIANHIRSAQTSAIKGKPPEKLKLEWTPDMRQDYARASPEERATLLQIWGVKTGG